MKTVCFIVFLCMLLLMPTSVLSFAAGEADASQAISEAENRVNACYMAVAEAQKAGANVSQLLSTLQEAGLLLSEAHVAFEKRDFDSAFDLANQSRSRLDGVDNEADSLRDKGRQDRSVDFLVNVVGSSVGAFAVLVGGFLFWHFSKKKHDKSEGQLNGR